MDLNVLVKVMVGVTKLFVIRLVPVVEGVSPTSLAFPIESLKAPIESVVTSKIVRYYVRSPDSSRNNTARRKLPPTAILPEI